MTPDNKVEIRAYQSQLLQQFHPVFQRRRTQRKTIQTECNRQVREKHQGIHALCV